MLALSPTELVQYTGPAPLTNESRIFYRFLDVPSSGNVLERSRITGFDVSSLERENNGKNGFPS